MTRSKSSRILSKTSSKKNLHNERTRIRETGAFFGEKGQRTVRSAPTTFFQQ